MIELPKPTRSLPGLGMGPRWAGKGVEARRIAQAEWTSGESLQRRIRPLSDPTRRAGAIYKFAGRHLSLPARCVGQPHGLADA